MMYSDRFVVAVKVGGEILRENKDSVSLPFGCEYSILLKNLNSVRSSVKVSVDGTDATEGTSLVIGPNDSLELERFIRNGNFDAGNRFKFIERTAKIEQHRGVGADDGLIRVEYKYEMRKPEVIERTIVDRHVPYYPPTPRPWYPPYPYRRWNDRRPMRPMRPTASAAPPMRKRKMMHPTQSLRNTPTMDCGITVPGSESSQKFYRADWFPTEAQSHVIVLRLVGMVGGKLVSHPVKAKDKPACQTCGKVNKGTAKCCVECGTALQLI